MHNESVYYHRYAQLSKESANQIAEQKWLEINEKNLKENLYPFLERAQMVIEKGDGHSVQLVRLRKF